MCPAFSHEKEFSILLREECIFFSVMVCVSQTEGTVSGPLCEHCPVVRG